MAPTPRPVAADAADLWAASSETAERCLRHPFVQGIARGTLPLHVFRDYVGQDAFFLDAFVRAYALALAKAPDARRIRAFKTLLDGAMAEQDLHAGYAARWQVDLHPQSTPATAAYTDFLLRVAALEPVAHICAAMAPCMRLYAWLGQQLLPLADPDSPYIQWVHTYADPGFASLAIALEELLDDLGGPPTTIAAHYATAMRLEHDFFDSAMAAGARSDVP